MDYRKQLYDMRGLGAVIGWCWSKWLQEWELSLLYWSIAGFKETEPQVMAVDRQFYTSGFMSQERGLHWHRRCRLARK